MSSLYTLTLKLCAPVDPSGKQAISPFEIDIAGSFTFFEQLPEIPLAGSGTFTVPLGGVPSTGLKARGSLRQISRIDNRDESLVVMELRAVGRELSHFAGYSLPPRRRPTRRGAAPIVTPPAGLR